MDLTKEQKYKIYLEEKDRLKREQEQQERDLINSLTDDEKHKIIEEIEARNTVHVTENDILFPDEKKTKKYTIIFSIAVMALFINIFIGAVLLISVLGYYVYLGIFKNFIVDPHIIYHCPKCDREHINIIRVEERNEQKSTGFINATCRGCKYKFRLVVGDAVLQILDIR